MRTLSLVLSLFLILTADATARMYQWTNPANGTVQLAGAPPGWYRGTHAGPRVFVFENGELIDDTAIAVSEERRLALRDAAFGAAEATPTSGSQSPAGDGESELRAALARASERGIDVDAVAGEFAATRSPEPAAGTEPVIDSRDKAAELKALIDAWDQNQLEQARSLLDLVPPAAPPAPAVQP